MPRDLVSNPQIPDWENPYNPLFPRDERLAAIDRVIGLFPSRRTWVKGQWTNKRMTRRCALQVINEVGARSLIPLVEDEILRGPFPAQITLIKRCNYTLDNAVVKFNDHRKTRFADVMNVLHCVRQKIIDKIVAERRAAMTAQPLLLTEEAPTSEVPAFEPAAAL